MVLFLKDMSINSSLNNSKFELNVNRHLTSMPKLNSEALKFYLDKEIALIKYENNNYNLKNTITFLNTCLNKRTLYFANPKDYNLYQNSFQELIHLSICILYERVLNVQTNLEKHFIVFNYLVKLYIFHIQHESWVEENFIRHIDSYLQIVFIYQKTHARQQELIHSFGCISFFLLDGFLKLMMGNNYDIKYLYDLQNQKFMFPLMNNKYCDFIKALTSMDNCSKMTFFIALLNKKAITSIIPYIQIEKSIQQLSISLDITSTLILSQLKLTWIQKFNANLMVFDEVNEFVKEIDDIFISITEYVFFHIKYSHDIVYYNALQILKLFVMVVITLSSKGSTHFSANKIFASNIFSHITQMSPLSKSQIKCLKIMIEIIMSAPTDTLNEFDQKQNLAKLIQKTLLQLLDLQDISSINKYEFICKINHVSDFFDILNNCKQFGGYKLNVMHLYCKWFEIMFDLSETLVIQSDMHILKCMNCIRTFLQQLLKKSANLLISYFFKFTPYNSTTGCITFKNGLNLHLSLNDGISMHLLKVGTLFCGLTFLMDTKYTMDIKDKRIEILLENGLHKSSTLTNLLELIKIPFYQYIPNQIFQTGIVCGYENINLDTLAVLSQMLVTLINGCWTVTTTDEKACLFCITQLKRSFLHVVHNGDAIDCPGPRKRVAQMLDNLIVQATMQYRKRVIQIAKLFQNGLEQDESKIEPVVKSVKIILETVSWLWNFAVLNLQSVSENYGPPPNDCLNVPIEEEAMGGEEFFDKGYPYGKNSLFVAILECTARELALVIGKIEKFNAVTYADGDSTNTRVLDFLRLHCSPRALAYASMQEFWAYALVQSCSGATVKVYKDKVLDIFLATSYEDHKASTLNIISNLGPALGLKFEPQQLTNNCADEDDEWGFFWSYWFRMATSPWPRDTLTSVYLLKYAIRLSQDRGDLAESFALFSQSFSKKEEDNTPVSGGEIRSMNAQRLRAWKLIIIFRAIFCPLRQAIDIKASTYSLPLFGLLQNLISLLRDIAIYTLRDVLIEDTKGKGGYDTAGISVVCNFFLEIIRECKAFAAYVFPFVKHPAPEGYIVEYANTTNMIGGQDHVNEVDELCCKDAHSPSSPQLFAMSCWRTLREISLLFGHFVSITSTQPNVVTELGDSQTLALYHVIVTECHEYFRDILIESLHMGTIELAYAGFCVMCNALFNPSNPLYIVVDHALDTRMNYRQKWLNELFRALLNDSATENTEDYSLIENEDGGFQKDRPTQSIDICVTRRGAGLPFYLLSLLTPSPNSSNVINYDIDKCDHLQTAMDNMPLPCDAPLVNLMSTLIHWACIKGIRSADPKAIMAMNLFRAIFRNTILGRIVVGSYCEPIMKFIIKPLYGSPHWPLKNAANLLFVPICKKIFGNHFGLRKFTQFDDIHDLRRSAHSLAGRTTSTTSLLSSKEFTIKYNALSKYLVDKLEEIAKLLKETKISNQSGLNDSKLFTPTQTLYPLITMLEHIQVSENHQPNIPTTFAAKSFSGLLIPPLITICIHSNNFYLSRRCAIVLAKLLPPPPFHSDQKCNAFEQANNKKDENAISLFTLLKNHFDASSSSEWKQNSEKMAGNNEYRSLFWILEYVLIKFREVLEVKAQCITFLSDLFNVTSHLTSESSHFMYTQKFVHLCPYVKVQFLNTLSLLDINSISNDADPLHNLTNLQLSLMKEVSLSYASMLLNNLPPSFAPYRYYTTTILPSALEANPATRLILGQNLVAYLGENKIPIHRMGICELHMFLFLLPMADKLASSYYLYRLKDFLQPEFCHVKFITLYMNNCQAKEHDSSYLPVYEYAFRITLAPLHGGEDYKSFHDELCLAMAIILLVNCPLSSLIKFTKNSFPDVHSDLDALLKLFGTVIDLLDLDGSTLRPIVKLYWLVFGGYLHRSLYNHVDLDVSTLQKYKVLSSLWSNVLTKVNDSTSPDSQPSRLIVTYICKWTSKECFLDPHNHLDVQDVCKFWKLFMRNVQDEDVEIKNVSASTISSLSDVNNPSSGESGIKYMNYGSCHALRVALNLFTTTILTKGKTRELIDFFEECIDELLSMDASIKDNTNNSDETQDFAGGAPKGLLFACFLTNINTLKNYISNNSLDVLGDEFNLKRCKEMSEKIQTYRYNLIHLYDALND